MKRILKGRSVSASDLKKLHESSYKDIKDEKIGDWVLDTEISRPTAVVYYNPIKQQGIVIHRGTAGTLKDWGNNLAYVMGTNKNTQRYKDAKEVQELAERKYPNLLTTGHSQGGIYTKLATNQKNVININPASMGETSTQGITIRSKTDSVSMLAAPTNYIKGLLRPSKQKQHITTSAHLNPLKAHSLDILDELGNQEFGGRINKTFAPNELSNIEIDILMKHYKIKNYHGCFVKNVLPSRLSNGFYIINLNGQSHWTALYKHGKNYLYYDSYGFVPPIEVEKKLPEYIYNDKQIQTLNQTSCGFYCVAWCRYLDNARNKRLAFEKFINLFTVASPVNEVILNQLLR
jgi:hypothetical protein